MSKKFTAIFLSSIDLKAIWLASGFTLSFLVWEAAVLKVPFIKYFFHTAETYNIKYFLFLQSIVIFSGILLFLYVYAALISPIGWKIVSILIFSFIVFFEYGYLNSLGRFSTEVDLEIALFMTNFEQKTGAISSYLSWMAIIPSLLFAGLILRYKSSRSFGKNYLLPISLFFTILFYFVVSTYFKQHFFGADFPLVSFENFFKVSVEIPPNWIITYNGNREELPQLKIEAPPKKNIVFITDESLRVDHMSLYGYSRETTPYLDKLEKAGKLTKFDSCVSGTTCSHSSASLLLTGVQIADLPDKDFKTKRYPTLYQYARAAGYKVHFLDGQMANFWNSPYRDQKYVDDWKNNSDFSKTAAKASDIDFEVAKEVKRIVSTSTGNFIWVWKRGVHFPYNDDYPADSAQWKPVSNSAQLASIPREELVNSYDSAIKYNSDGFFKILAPAIEENENTVLIYTSDHGQNLRDGEQLATHCQQTKNEANVPLFMLGEFDTELPADFPARHENIFPTLLDLMDIPASFRKYDYADSLLNPRAKRPKHRYYWSLDVTSGNRLEFD
ncbi:MAG: sulfatase-like hydrolase/transferase [Acidobacteria bacterium]|nr:sulfatase-like hydrolase/transferase [Acidobacteriota bacterium]